tara:strand:+ start:117037 stop:118266 length:1230 start_codon:yes stop_codon:yes gene_type:complete
MYSQQPYSKPPLLTDPSLVGAWLNPLTKGTFKDASVSQNNGTLNGKVSLYDSNDEAESLNQGYIDITTNYSFDETNDVTIAYSFKTTDTSQGASNAIGNPFLASSNGGSLTMATGVDNGKVTLHFYNGAWNKTSGATNVSDGVWHRLVYVFKSDATFKAYLDGKLEIADSSWGITNAHGIFSFLTQSGNRADGSISNVEIYNETKDENWINWDYKRRVPDPSLLLWLPYGDKDYSRYNRAIIGTNIAVGNKITLNGAASRIDAGSDILANATEASVAFWIKVDSLSGVQRMIDNRNFSIITLSGGIHFFSRLSIGNPTTPYPMPVSNFVHISATISTTGLANVYVNGVVVNPPNEDIGTLLPGTTNIFIGNNDTFSKGYDGKISDVRIYDEVKSPEFIQNLYKQTRNFY